MGPRAVELVAEIIDRIEDRQPSTGRPPMPTIKVVEALRFFLREGVQWRELRATAKRACGSTLRRRLDEWSGTAALRQVHAALVRMVRSGPEAVPWDVVVDSCSVRAKHGGELTGPNPRGPTRYRIAWGGPTTQAKQGPSNTSWSRPTASRWASSPRLPTSTTRGSFPIFCAWPKSSVPPSATCTPMPLTTVPSTERSAGTMASSPTSAR